jgi:hypothetical protein
VLQKDRARKKEISEGTIPNFKKPVKLFLEMNDVTLNWKKKRKKCETGRAKLYVSMIISVLGLLWCHSG